MTQVEDAREVAVQIAARVAVRRIGIATIHRSLCAAAACDNH